MGRIKWKFVTPADRLKDLQENAAVYNMTPEEYAKYEQWESVDAYVNFPQGLGWQRDFTEERKG